VGRRKVPEGKEVLSLWVNLTTGFVCRRVIACSTDRQTSLREKTASVIPYPSSKFSATQRGECVGTEAAYSVDELLGNV